MGDTVTGFEAWRQALADTMAFAREIGCQPAVLQTLAAMVGDAQPADWRDNGAHWLHMASDAPWNQAARDAAATVPASELAKFIHMVFNTQVRLEQMQASRLALPLLKRAWPEASKLPGYVSKSRMYIGWACAIAVKAALRRKPALTDETALTQLRALQRALLHWAADDASEPDLPLKEVLAWVASHPFGMRTQAAALVERIAQAIELVPAGDAQDRKYTAHLMKSVETLRAQLAEPATPAADAVTPRAQAYPAASFHRDWDAMAKPVMQALGFERVKGGVSRWIKPVGARWLHVGFHPGKWGWTRHGGGEFFVAVELSAASDPGAVDARDGVHLFLAYSDAEFAPFMALNARARDTIRRLSFADEATRRLKESLLVASSRGADRRAPGDMTPSFRFYDPAELADWAQALMPTLGFKLEQALAAHV